ncbi:hypothetical protein COHA_010764 [Chlorella ohadii]|uniref:Uncharacterized protein n=1 Tax=Chlorella ohadii TaxID=2649997 RepID=A0AAD5DJ77_9CHLO|nr:hypothetical protein COHA_010764 [Chlorella ohadii]
MPGFWQGLADWLGWQPVPGTPEHREALFRAAKKKLLRRNAQRLLQRLDLGCCPDCPRVHRREAASLQAMAAWHEEWEQVCSLRLQALEQGHPYPPLTLPYLELQPFLPEGLPEDFPPSIDRCAACQNRLEEYLFIEQDLKAGVDSEP